MRPRHSPASAGSGASLEPDGKVGGDRAPPTKTPGFDVARAQLRSITPCHRRHAVAFSSQGDLLATGGDDKLTLSERCRWQGCGRAWAMASDSLPSFHPDGTKLASGSVDKTIRI